MDQFELYLYLGCQLGWCLICKELLCDVVGWVVGFVGILCDLKVYEGLYLVYSWFVDVVQYIQDYYVQLLNLKQFVQMVGMLVVQFECYFYKVFYLILWQVLLKMWFDVVIVLFVMYDKVIDVVVLCGYMDYSVFMCQFKVMVGVMLMEYWLMLQEWVG